MPKNRISTALILACLIPVATWAQPPAGPGLGQPPAAKEPPTEAETQIDAATKQVEALKSVSADLIQKVDMLDQKFEIKGRYLKGLDRRVYLRLTVSGLPDASGTLLQVCDGQMLWDYKKILDGESVRRFDVGKVLDKLKSPDLDASMRETITSQLGFAGPEELLRGLRKSVRFDSRESSTLDGQDVWVFRGEWRNRNGIMNPKQQQQPLPPTVALPAYYPSLVVLYLGKVDGWPYKLTMVGRKPSVLMDKSNNAGEARRIASQDVQPTRIELIYSNVVLNPNLNLAEFAFQPPSNLRIEDDTAQMVQGLDQMIAMQAAQKKAEAAKSDVPTLDGTLNVPVAPAEKPGLGGLPTIPDKTTKPPATGGTPK